MTTELEWLGALRKDLRRDIREAELSKAEARYLVDTYYQIQHYRIQSAAQVRSELHEPRRWAETLFRTFELLERDLQTTLGDWARREVAGAWAQSITGVGPVISAGLVAHIEVRRETEAGLAITHTAGQLWRFAGLDPTLRWEKGQKRPWNADLKVLCWKLGDSFVKQSGRDSDVYGKIYRARKALEVERNAAGLFADQAAGKLKDREIKDKALRATLQAGRLPDGQIDLRARRYAVKLFLAHYHHVAFESTMGYPPDKPYILSDQASIRGHTHYMAPPNWPLIAANVVSTEGVERHARVMTDRAARMSADEGSR